MLKLPGEPLASYQPAETDTDVRPGNYNFSALFSFVSWLSLIDGAEANVVRCSGRMEERCDGRVDAGIIQMRRGQALISLSTTLILCTVFKSCCELHLVVGQPGGRRTIEVIKPSRNDFSCSGSPGELQTLRGQSSGMASASSAPWPCSGNKSPHPHLHVCSEVPP